MPIGHSFTNSPQEREPGPVRREPWPNMLSLDHIQSKFWYAEATWKMKGRPEEGVEQDDKDEQQAKCQRTLDSEATEILNSWRELMLPRNLQR